VEIVLGAFTSSCVRTRLGSDLAGGVELATRHYGRRLRSAQTPPPFGDLPVEPDAPAVAVDVTLDPGDIALLEAEAGRAGCDLQQLVTHAILVYIADLDRDRDGCGGRGRGRLPLGRL
jgi:hypothetical protein